MSIILVNATAARNSGALSILKQFTSNIEKYINNNIYYIFVDPTFSTNYIIKNVIYVKVDTKKWIERIKWDLSGLNKWCKKRAIIPDLIISFQNMGVKCNKQTPQLIYYHQPIPLSEHSWNLFDKKEIKLFLYKHFYLFFTKFYINQNTYFVVQIPSIKRSLLDRIKIKDEKVYIIPPEIQTINYDKIDCVCFNDNKIHFIYPATCFIYKNHEIIFQALRVLKKKNPIIFNKIQVHLTLTYKEIINNYLDIEDIIDAIKFEGTMEFDKLLSYYKSMTALLFPSYIESFGLPLLEAAGAGIPIIASDLPYVHDVVGEYKGVNYVKYSDANKWAEAIQDICINKKKHNAFNYTSDQSNWKNFFEIIENIKNINYVSI